MNDQTDPQQYPPTSNIEPREQIIAQSGIEVHAGVEHVLAPEPYQMISTHDENPPHAAADVIGSFEAGLGSTHPDEPAATLGAPFESLAQMLTQRFDHLQALFEREARAETARERVVDRLHAELEEYKQDLLLKVMKPLFIDLIQLHDDIGKMTEAWDRPDLSNDVCKLVETIRSFQQGIEDILYRQGVEPYQVEGDTFDARRQRAVASVPCDDSSRARTICKRLRKGFQTGEKIIRSELVSVYTFKA